MHYIEFSSIFNLLEFTYRHKSSAPDIQSMNMPQRRVCWTSHDN